MSPLNRRLGRATHQFRFSSSSSDSEESKSSNDIPEMFCTPQQPNKIFYMGGGGNEDEHVTSFKISQALEHNRSNVEVNCKLTGKNVVKIATLLIRKYTDDEGRYNGRLTLSLTFDEPEALEIFLRKLEYWGLEPSKLNINYLGFDGSVSPSMIIRYAKKLSQFNVDFINIDLQRRVPLPPSVLRRLSMETRKQVVHLDRTTHALLRASEQVEAAMRLLNMTGAQETNGS